MYSSEYLKGLETRECMPRASSLFRIRACQKACRERVLRSWTHTVRSPIEKLATFLLWADNVNVIEDLVFSYQEFPKSLLAQCCTNKLMYIQPCGVSDVAL